MTPHEIDCARLIFFVGWVVKKLGASPGFDDSTITAAHGLVVALERERDEERTRQLRAKLRARAAGGELVTTQDDL